MADTKGIIGPRTVRDILNSRGVFENKKVQKFVTLDMKGQNRSMPQVRMNIEGVLYNYYNPFAFNWLIFLEIC